MAQQVMDGLPLTWALRFLGDPDLRRKRQDLEMRLQRLTGAAFLYVQGEIHKAWLTECQSALRKWRDGSALAEGRKVPLRPDWLSISAVLWDPRPLPRIEGLQVHLADAIWYDVRIYDQEGLPLAMAAEAYGDAPHWRILADYDQAAPLPYNLGNGLIFERGYAGYLIGTPAPTPEQAEQQRTDLLQQLQTPDSYLELWGDRGHGPERMAANESLLTAIDWDRSIADAFQAVRVRAVPRQSRRRSAELDNRHTVNDEWQAVAWLTNRFAQGWLPTRENCLTELRKQAGWARFPERAFRRVWAEAAKDFPDLRKGGRRRG